MGKAGRKDWGGRRAGGPPLKEGFIWHTSELLTSPAWRSRSIHCVRLLEFLEIEHLSHGGFENGSLLATYNQLEKFGIGRRFISGAIKEAEDCGLVTVQRGSLKGRQLTEVTRFRLTYLWTKSQSNGLWDWQLPTDDWKNYKEKISAPFASIGAPLTPKSVHHSELPSVHVSEPASSQPIENAAPAVVHYSEPPSISWVHTETSPKQPGRGKPSSKPESSFPSSQPDSPKAKPSSAAHLLQTNFMKRQAHLAQRRN